ncbi:hypothetical protein ACN9ML_01115 [Dyadobacter endophyticus]|uniref:Por secretion system C-terminal sorting domain-containing protein n=1 Tax=Dyadobacter endophyticus TaxID=1749036 RepID=A0ABQ1YDD4_9BACT|nr:hypothetical protein [Dyadobacter endophyticus]GGH21235.1 hypothetical protein GCM10007423_02210 [Dyadobacter endophyticus]
MEVFRADGSKVTWDSNQSGYAIIGPGRNFREINLSGQKPGIYVVVVNGKSFKILKN